MLRKNFQLCVYSEGQQAVRLALSGRGLLVALLLTPICLVSAAYLVGRLWLGPSPLHKVLASSDNLSGPFLDDTLSRIESAFDANPDSVPQRLAELKGYEDRLQSLESQVRARMGLLDSVLEDATALEHQPGATADFGGNRNPLNSKKSDNQDTAKGGIGGEEGPLPPASTMLTDPVSFESTDESRADFLLKALDFYNDEVAKIPVGVPVQGKLSSEFGWRTSPFSMNRQFHRGLDLSVDQRSRVVSTADGVVIKAEYAGGLGRNVIVRHGNGIETVYGHLSKISVSPGMRVCRGELLGFVGSSGRSTGPHLHYEVRIQGISRDPRPYLELASTLRLFGKAQDS